MQQRLLRATEVRRVLDINSVARVYSLARRGVLPGVVRIGRQVRFDPAKISAFIDGGGVPLPKTPKARAICGERNVGSGPPNSTTSTVLVGGYASQISEQGGH